MGPLERCRVLQCNRPDDILGEPVDLHFKWDPNLAGAWLVPYGCCRYCEVGRYGEVEKLALEEGPG